MKKDAQNYTKPQVRTVGAAEILEVLGPVSAGSYAGSTDSGECTMADYMLGTKGC